MKLIEHKSIVNSYNVLDLIKDYDIIIDGTDNFPTRYCVNDACVLAEEAECVWFDLPVRRDGDGLRAASEESGHGRAKGPVLSVHVSRAAGSGLGAELRGGWGDRVSAGHASERFRRTK